MSNNTLSVLFYFPLSLLFFSQAENIQIKVPNTFIDLTGINKKQTNMLVHILKFNIRGLNVIAYEAIIKIR